MRLWSDNAWEWGVFRLPPLFDDTIFNERNKMTDEQEIKIMKMDDQKMLIELAIAYGNTDDADLGEYHRRNLLAIFVDLDLDHMDAYPSDSKRKDGTEHVKSL